MGWVGSGEDFCGLGCVGSRNFGLGWVEFWKSDPWPTLICRLYFYFYYMRWRMPPFMHQCWGLQVGPVHETAGTGKLSNAALLSLLMRACVSICCATLLLSQLVGTAFVQTRSSNPKGRACGPSGKGSGEEGILSGVVPVYLYCPAFNVSVSLGV